jgi:hypothetical protein
MEIINIRRVGMRKYISIAVFSIILGLVLSLSLISLADTVTAQNGDISIMNPNPRPIPESAIMNPNPRPVPKLSTWNPNPRPVPELAIMNPNPRPVPKLSTWNPNPRPGGGGPDMK